MAEKSSAPQKGKSQSKSAQSEVSSTKEGSGSSLEDNRQESKIQLKIKEGMDVRALSAPALPKSASFIVQKKTAVAAAPVVKAVVPTTPKVVAAQLKPAGTEEKDIQSPSPLSVETVQLAAGVAAPPPSSGSSSGSGGLPSGLKSGVEQLSGQSMSDVKVHQNSEKPAQLNAHAYAQGTDIHLGPGQEKHLPHEAWHVAQQKQGRVEPTRQMKGKVLINDDKGLEHEADVMGAKALEVGQDTIQAVTNPGSTGIGNTVQLETSGGAAETVTTSPEGGQQEPEASMSALFDENQTIEQSAAVEEESAEEEPESVKKEEEAEETVAEQLQDLLKTTPPPKYTKKAFILTTDSLRKIKESSKAYEGIKAEHQLKASESATAQTPTGEPEASSSAAESETVQRFAILDKAKSFFGFGKKNSEAADQAKPAGDDKKKTKKKEVTPEDRITKILEKGQVEEKVEGTPSMVDKFKTFFGFGKKTNLKLSPELSPKKFKFPTGIPVKIDPGNKIAGWVAVKLDMNAGEKALKSIKDGEKIWGALKGQIKADNSEGYFPFKKLAVTDLDLNNASGVRISEKAQVNNMPPLEVGTKDKEKAKGLDGRQYVWGEKSKSWQAPNGDQYYKDSKGLWTKRDKPLLERVGKKVVSTLSGVESVANAVNSAIDSGTEKINEAIEMAKERAKDIDVLKNVELEVPAGGTRLIPGQGFLISPSGGYDFGIEGAPNKLMVTPSLMVNIKNSDDWFVEYRGTVLEVPTFSLGSDETVKVDVNLGTLSHQPTEGGSIFKSTGGEASVTFLNQTLGVKVEEASINTAATTSRFTYKIAEFSGKLNVLNTNLMIKVEQPSFNDGKLDFAKASGEIPEVVPFEGVKFTEVKAAMLKNEDASKNIGGSAKFNVTNEYIEEASGGIGIFKKGKGDTDLILSDGKLKATVFGQTLQLDGVSYDSSKESGVVHLEQGNLSLNIENPIHDSNITGEFSIHKAKLSSNSFTYEKANAKVGDIEVGYGLSFKDIQAEIDKSGEEEQFVGTGKLDVAHKSVTASGLIKISKSGDDDLRFSLTEGKLDAEIFGTKVNAQNVYYNSTTNSLGADSVTANIPLPFPTGTINKDLTITEPTLKDGEFTFGKITLNVGDLEPMAGVQFTGVVADVENVREKLVYNGTGGFKVQRGPIDTAEGRVTIGMSGKNPYFYLQNGSLRGSVLGGVDNLVASGITYSHANKNRMAISRAKLDKVMVFGSEVGFELEEASYDDVNGFDFKKATATLSEIGLTNDIKANNIILNVEKKDDESYRIVSNADFVAGGTLYGLTLTTSGKIEVSKDGAEPASAELINAGIKLTSGEQSFELTNVSYGSGIFSAGAATGNFLLPFTEGGHKLTTAVKDLKIGNGFTFSEATVNPNLSVSFGFASANLTELKLQRNEIGNKVSGTGGISVGGGSILGKKIPQLSGTGVVSHQFKNDKSAGTTEKNLVGVAGKLPAFNLPKDVLPSGLWPLGASISIPVAPGAQVKVYAGVGGGVESKDTGLSLTKKDEDTYTLGAHTNDLTLSLYARVGAGLEAGNPFVASVMVGVEGEGKISAKAKMDFSKDFSISEPAADLDIPISDTSAFTYKVGGDIKLVAKLVFEATALFFLSKRWEKTLAEKSMGTFEKENGGEWKFERPTEPIRPTDEELMKDVSSNLPASLKGKSKEELNDLHQQKRFSADTTKDVIAIFKETSNTVENPSRLFDYGTFNYKRFDWEKIKASLPVVIDNAQETDTPEVAIDAPMPEVTAGSEESSETPAATEKPGWFGEFKKSIKRAGAAVQAEVNYSKSLKELGLAINSKKEFIDTYKRQADKLERKRSGSNHALGQIIELHLALAAIYLEANNNLKRKVHSSMLGDKAQQRLTHLKRFVGARGLKSDGAAFQGKISQAQSNYERVKYFEGLYVSSKQSSSTGQNATGTDTSGS